MLLKKEAAIHEGFVPRKLLLDDQLGHVKHDLGAKLVNLEEFDDRL